MNQMVSQIMGQQTNPIVQAWQTIQMASDPKQALVTALSKCKNGKEAIEALNKSNWNEEQAFYEFAKQQGVDANQFLQSLQSMGLNR